MVQFLGQFDQDEVHDVLAGHRRKLEELGDDAGEEEVGVHVALHDGRVLEKLTGESARVRTLLCGMLAGCMIVIFGRETRVCGHGVSPLFTECVPIF